MAGEGRLAEQIRTRLELVKPKREFTVVNGKGANDVEISPLDVMLFRKPIRQHVKEFGCVFGLIMLIGAWYLVHKQGAPVAALGFTAFATVFVGLAYRAPALMHPLWKGWMAFAHKLSLVMTFAILSFAWTIVMMPMALLLKVLRIKVMDTSFKTGAATYWETRDPKFDNFKLLERQF